MSSSHKARVNGGGASAGRRTAGGSSQSKSHQRKEAAAAVSVSVAHTIDDDYTETLEKQITKEKASKADTNAIGAAKKKKQHFKAADDGDDDGDEDLSPDAIKKAMAAAMKDNDDDDDKRKSASSSSRSSSTKSAPGHANAKVKRAAGESEEDYKQRLKAEMRKRKNDKRKQARSSVISEKMAAAHQAALDRRAEKQRQHLERQAAERAAKAERIAQEKEALPEGLTNKQKRLLKEKNGTGDVAVSKAAKSSASTPSAPTKSTSSTTTAGASKPNSKATPTPPATTGKSSKPTLVPADLTTPLPKHHDWAEFNLHPAILRALLIDLKFMTPTPIQKEVLTPAIRDWKDISAAATTGSGKTLAFGIPIVQRLLQLQEEDGWTDPKKMQALILTPTRELALQIVQHLEAISRYATPAIGVAAIVGGISEDKQKRILDKKHPAIVVATPGRLCELIFEAELTHLSSAYYLRFLVLDEADRMVDFGHFAELERILHFIQTHSTYESIQAGKVYKKAVEVFDGFEMLEDEHPEHQQDDDGAEEDAANYLADGEEGADQPDGGDATEGDEPDEDVSAAARAAMAELTKGRGKKVSAKLASAKSAPTDDIDWDSFLTEEQIFAKQGRKMPKESAAVEEAGEESEEEEEEEDEDGEDDDEDMELDDEDMEQDEDAEDEDMPDADEDDEDENEEEAVEAEDDSSTDPSEPPVGSKTLRRQIFLFSATLMLPSSGREDASKVRTKKKNVAAPETVLEKLADKITFQKNSKPFIVDLSTTHQVASTLQEVRMECVTADKDYFTYYFLVLYPGKTLIFVNSISCLRRLVNILAHLKINVLGLHAEMQQKARLKSLERFKTQENSVLVCTDVAARGLDIPQVPYILHYQLPRTSDVYIHRSGRVARAGTDGLSCALIDENDTKNYRRLCLVLKKVNGIPALPVDQGFMTQIRSRMHVARELDLLTNAERKSNSQRDWFVRQAEAMEMELDEDEMQLTAGKKGKRTGGDDDGDDNGANDDIKKENLRRELDFLLSKPLMHGTLNRKFYTLNAARGFDLNKESAGIAVAGTSSLEKNGAIRVGGNAASAQNIAVGMTNNSKGKLPEMLRKARDGETTVAHKTQTPAATEASEEKKQVDKSNKKKNSGKSAAPVASSEAEPESDSAVDAAAAALEESAPAEKVVISLSAKRKTPEPPAPRKSKKAIAAEAKAAAADADADKSDQTDAAEPATQQPTKKQKVKK